MAARTGLHLQSEYLASETVGPAPTHQLPVLTCREIFYAAIPVSALILNNRLNTTLQVASILKGSAILWCCWFITSIKLQELERQSFWLL
jgi:hypothetical protein